MSKSQVLLNLNSFQNYNYKERQPFLDWKNNFFKKKPFFFCFIGKKIMKMTSPIADLEYLLSNLVYLIGACIYHDIITSELGKDFELNFA